MIAASSNRRLPAAVTLICLIAAGCSGEVQPEIVAGMDACAECSMLIDRPREAAGYVHHGKFVTFDSPVCLLRGYESLRGAGEELPSSVYFADYETGTLQAADAMTFLLSGHFTTVMEGGVLCFAERDAAIKLVRHDDEILTDWAGLQLARGEPDRVLEVSFSPTGMLPETVEASKGELLLWRASGERLERELEISVEGYPELGSVVVPASGTEVVFRMKAVRPGDGFPIVVASSGQTVGRLKVSGSHTRDEEAK